jgi:hypothetical protein
MRQVLGTQISKDDGYQKQQDTLVVWTEQIGTNTALSFEELKGCASIWSAKSLHMAVGYPTTSTTSAQLCYRVRILSSFTKLRLGTWVRQLREQCEE